MRAGYTKASANREGYRLLAKPEIAAAIATQHQARLAATNITADRVIQELGRIAFGRPKQFWTPEGDLVPIEQLSDEDAACLAGFEAIIKNAKAGDGVTDTIHKIKFWDKVRALETLARHFKLLVDTVALTGDADLIALLQSARPRADKAKKL